MKHPTHHARSHSRYHIPRPSRHSITRLEQGCVFVEVPEVNDLGEEDAAGDSLIQVLGAVTQKTRGIDLCRPYELVSIEPYCAETVPENCGDQPHRDCAA